jgi:polar amino acid transport system substrate-binding protein
MILAAAVLGLGLTATACSSIAPSSTSASGGTSTAAADACSNAAIQPDLHTKGQLTVATDSPAYTPWFVNNQPSNGQGYEAGVAYAVAAQLGFAKSQVKWVVEPFDSSYAPGPKSFDFDINEISYTPQRAQAVTFSISYYNDQQALVALKGSPIITKHTPAELKTYVYGDQVGTTSLAYINDEIKPDQTPKVYDTLNDVAEALATKQITAFVTDVATAQYIASSAEIPKSVAVAQFPNANEYYALLFPKGDPLVSCVDKAITTITNNGTIASLTKKYLSIYTSIPTIQP